MFGSRRRRPPNPPLNASTASPSAATAAISAFTRRESSTASLSAAAAAAALKARPTTPTNVAEVQTKRTRRSGSRSSSAGRSTPDTSARPGGQLRRQSSSGSMTERTFRSTSPGVQPQRSLSSSGIPRNSYQSDDMAPPVPAIPQSVNMQAAQARQKPKSLGIVTAPVRTASQKANKASGSWFGAAKTGDPANVRTSDAVMSTSPTSQTHPQTHAQRRESLDGPGSRGSPVNFSYPARIRSPTFTRPEESPQPPTAVPEPHVKPKRRSSTISPQRGGSVRSARSSSVTTDQTLVYDPNSRRMVPQADLSALEQSIQTASETKPKKKKQAPARTGSHLAKGTVGRSQGSAVESGRTNAAQVAAATSLRSHKAEDRRSLVHDPEDEGSQPTLKTSPLAPRTAAATEQRKDAAAPQSRRAQSSMSPASNAPEVFPASYSPAIESQETSLQRRPSVVREESELEALDSEIELEAPDRISTPPKSSAALDSVPARQNVYAHGVPSPPRSDLTEDVPVEPTRPAPAIPIELGTAPPPSTEPRAITRDGSEVVAEPQGVQNIPRDSRDHSKSPVRSARFGPVHDSLTVRHEPPPRSISPRKSALKHQSPSRGISPADAASDGSEAGFPLHEQTLPRKKSVRVSFDDGNTVVVGEAAGSAETDSPLPPSPQVASRRPWYSSLGIGKKKDALTLEDDEGMKPRPILPTFGSVRGRKQSAKEPEERPLVRPHEPVHEESEPPTPEPLGKDVDPVGQSSDRALGAIIHEQEPKNEANISKFREPLPPVVTSVEGSGYASDTASDDSEAALMADTPRLQADESRVSETSTLVPDWKPSNVSAYEPVGHEEVRSDVKDFEVDPRDVSADVPAISVTQPSPRTVESEQDRSSYRFPGEFPETDAESDAENKVTVNDATLTDSSAPARQVAFEPGVQKEGATDTVHTPSTVLATKPAAQELTDGSEGDSIYSDAYEDPLALEGDGFQSLDAVFGSPPRQMPSDIEKVQARIPEPPTPSLAQKASGHESAAIAAIQNEGVSGPIDDWEAAKAYWRSLTAEKRAQLEKEAAEEAGAEGDLEDVKPDVKKPRRKKSIEKRHAEKKAIEEQRAASDHERTYMVKPGSKAEDYSSAEQSKPRGVPASEKVEAATKLRKTMRSPGGNPSQPTQSVETGSRMRKSLRPDAPSRSAAAPQQPAPTPSAMGITAKISVPKRHSRAVSEPQGRLGITQPSLRRHGSDSSASSFKRSRPASQGFAFRKTMRTGNGSQDADITQDRQPSRLSLRSISPGGGRASSLGGQPPVTMDGRLRTTLRGGPPANNRRSSQDSGKGYLRFSGSFGQKAKPRKGSRFDNDSSGEDEADVPRRFSSRFEDSSDEEIVPELLPSLSMPKTMRGTSTRSRNAPPSPPLPEEEELSDEEGPCRDEEDDKSHHVTSGPAPMPQAQTDTSVKRSRSGRGSLPRADEGVGRPARRSFMSSVLRRNKKQGSGAISRPERRESAARADTNLERTPDELNALRANSSRDRADSGAAWPLHEGVPEHESLEAETTREPDDVKGAHVVEGGAAAVDGQRHPSVLGHSKSQPSLSRPSFLQRRTMSHQGTIDTDIVGSDAGGRKKKKFGALRKMFKLDE